MTRPFGTIGFLFAIATTIAQTGCTTPVELGVFRLPIQTGETSMTLQTLLARVEGEELVLRDPVTDTEFGRALARGTWMGELQPYRFEDRNGFPFALFVRDGVIEDVETRPFETQPVPPIESAARITVVTLESRGQQATLLRAGETVFANEALTPPESDSTPGPLAALGSVSGAGFVLRDDAVQGAEWKDAVSTLIPLVRSRPMMCGMPLRSVYRSLPNARAEVPAGSFNAIHTSEIVDVCPDADDEPTVWNVERWFAPGTGPVQMLLTLSDGKTREYRLAKTNATGASSELWPLAEGLYWEFEVIDGDGVAGENARVEVSSVVERSFPSD